jgi:hypothetical protein
MFKINCLGKVKSSLMLDPGLLTLAKSQAAKDRVTLGNVVEMALADYLQRARVAEEEKERMRKEEEERERQEQIRRFSETGYGLPLDFIFKHYLGEDKQ